MDIFNMILAALSVALDEMFPAVPVYTETVPQKLPPRCFLIGFAGGTEIVRELTGRYRVSGKLDITYLPPKKQDEPQTARELNAVFSTLALGLGVIGFDGVLLKLTNHSRTDTGDALHDICAFTTFLYREDLTPAMSSISIDKEELK